MQGHETREEREERLCPRCWAELFVVGTGKATRAMEWEPPEVEICLRCAEAERQDSMLESDSPPVTMWPLPPDFLAREWLAIVRQRQQAERQRLEAELTTR